MTPVRCGIAVLWPAADRWTQLYSLLRIRKARLSLTESRQPHLIVTSLIGLAHPIPVFVLVKQDMAVEH